MKVTLHLEGNKKALIDGAQEFIKNLLNEGEAATAPKKRGRPAKTVSDEEEEGFGSKEIEEEELEEEESEEEEELEASSDEEEEESEEEEEEDEEVTFADLKKVIGKYGETKPKSMTAILNSFNIKTTAELKKNPKKWLPVFRKVSGLLKATKGKK